MKYLILVLGVAALSTAFTTQQEHGRFRRQVPVTRLSTTYPVGTRRTSEGVPILPESYRNSRVASQSTRHHSPQVEGGITLYNDFVNDPYVSTEDLGSLLTQRHGAKELRTGHQSVDSNRDQLWATRSGNNPARQAHQSQQQRVHESVDRSQSHPVDPVNAQGNAWWTVSSSSGDHITYTRRGASSSSTNVNAENANRQTGRSSGLNANSGRAEHQTRQGQAQPARSGALRAGGSRGPAANWRAPSGAQESRAAIQSGASDRASASALESRYDENGDDTWIVASRSDDHITYRKRNQGVPEGRAQATSQHRGVNSEQVQRLGRGEGQVLARVVDTRGSGEEESAGRRSNYRTETRQQGGSQLASYNSMRRHYAHGGQDDTSSKPSLQLKSGDFVSYKSQDGSEAVYPRLRGGETRNYQRPAAPQRGALPATRHQSTHQATNQASHQAAHLTSASAHRTSASAHQTSASAHQTSASVPQEFEQQGNWRVISKDDSHITWTRVGSEYERNPSTTLRPLLATRQLHSRNQRFEQQQSVEGAGPHYPMLLERETAERANRLGSNNGLRIAY